MRVSLPAMNPPVSAWWEVVRAASNCAFAPYAIDNVKVVGYDVVMNRPKSNAYRAPGSPISAFAVESTLDVVAKSIGMDPAQLRLKNAATPGTPMAEGCGWEARDLLQGQALELDIEGQKRNGTAIGVDAYGGLLLQAPDGAQRLVEGGFTPIAGRNGLRPRHLFIATDTTEDGMVWFVDLEPGTYTVRESAVAGGSESHCS